MGTRDRRDPIPRLAGALTLPRTRLELESPSPESEQDPRERVPTAVIPAPELPELPGSLDGDRKEGEEEGGRRRVEPPARPLPQGRRAARSRAAAEEAAGARRERSPTPFQLWSGCGSGSGSGSGTGSTRSVPARPGCAPDG